MMTPSTQAVQAHVATSGPLLWLFPTTTACSHPRWLRPRRHAEHQDLAQRPDMIGQSRGRHCLAEPLPLVGSGCGKTWLACALGHQACREGWTVLSLRLPRLLQEFPLAKGDGRYVKLMTALAKTDVLILDDWGLAPLSDDNRRDLLELLEDRHDCRATIVTSQLPVEHWHEAIGEPTLAHAILDRLVHNAYKIALKGDSMRKRQATVPRPTPAV